MDIEAPAAEIDLVVSGGGLKGYYGVGAVHVLLRHLSAHNIGVRRVAGTSAGAWVAFFILTGMSVANWLETYYALQRNPEAKIVDVYREVWHAWMKHTIPEDTYKTCSGRLFITTTIITPWGLRECCTSTFASNDEIFDACCASSQVGCTPQYRHNNAMPCLLPSCSLTLTFLPALDPVCHRGPVLRQIQRSLPPGWGHREQLPRIHGWRAAPASCQADGCRISLPPAGQRQ